MVRQESDLVGGRLCLDFVNTVSWRGTDAPRDNVDSYPRLLRWCVRAGALSRTEAATLRRVAAEHPQKAVTVIVRARELREAIYRVVISWKRGRAPSRADLALVNGSAPPRGELVWRRGRLAWANESRVQLESPLWPIIWSFADLVTSGEPRRVSASPVFTSIQRLPYLYFLRRKAGRHLPPVR